MVMYSPSNDNIRTIWQSGAELDGFSCTERIRPLYFALTADRIPSRLIGSDGFARFIEILYFVSEALAIEGTASRLVPIIKKLHNAVSMDRFISIVFSPVYIKNSIHTNALI